MDPNPIKHPAVLLARARDAIAPLLKEAGFRFDTRNNPRDRGRENLWIDWMRRDEILSLRWDRHKAVLSLEFVKTSDVVQTIASVCTSGVRSSEELSELLNRFVAQVQNIESLKAHHPD
jgi:hypothetical protein